MRPLTEFLKTKAFAGFSGLSLRSGQAEPKAAPAPLPRQIMRKSSRNTVAPMTSEALQILCPDPTAEDALRDKHLAQAQKLVRQERWSELSDLIRAASMTRKNTPGAMPVADLMAYGARADVVLAAEHALMDGRPAPDAPLLAGIEALEHVLAEHEDDCTIACIVAQAHMDIGWAWRGTGWDVEVPDRNRAAFKAHFDRAAEIIAPFVKMSPECPLLAATHCAMIAGGDIDTQEVIRRYENLILMNHGNPRSMRAMGHHLLPRWYGSYADLEVQARRMAALTSETWGAGGYTWVQFDAIAVDDEACANLDLPFFVDGMKDILSRKSDPYIVNLLAAYCANAVGQSFSGNDEADQVRAQIADCAGWIVRNHLTELHPMIWAHAARGFDNNFHVCSPNRFAASGRDDAMRIITALFSREIAAGKRIVFTETGAVAHSG